MKDSVTELKYFQEHSSKTIEVGLDQNKNVNFGWNFVPILKKEKPIH